MEGTGPSITGPKPVSPGQPSKERERKRSEERESHGRDRAREKIRDKERARASEREREIADRDRRRLGEDWRAGPGAHKACQCRARVSIVPDHSGY